MLFSSLSFYLHPCFNSLMIPILKIRCIWESTILSIICWHFGNILFILTGQYDHYGLFLTVVYRIINFYFHYILPFGFCEWYSLYGVRNGFGGSVYVCEIWPFASCCVVCFTNSPPSPLPSTCPYNSHRHTDHIDPSLPTSSTLPYRSFLPYRFTTIYNLYSPYNVVSPVYFVFAVMTRSKAPFLSLLAI